jgi:hypothetical protein
MTRIVNSTYRHKRQRRGDTADALFREMKRRLAVTASRPPKKPGRS